MCKFEPRPHYLASLSSRHVYRSLSQIPDNSAYLTHTTPQSRTLSPTTSPIDSTLGYVNSPPCSRPLQHSRQTSPETTIEKCSVKAKTSAGRAGSLFITWLAFSSVFQNTASRRCPSRSETGDHVQMEYFWFPNTTASATQYEDIYIPASDSDGAHPLINAITRTHPQITKA